MMVYNGMSEEKQPDCLKFETYKQRPYTYMPLAKPVMPLSVEQREQLIKSMCKICCNSYRNMMMKRRMINDGESADDLFSEGYINFFNTLDCFDVSRIGKLGCENSNSRTGVKTLEFYFMNYFNERLRLLHLKLQTKGKEINAREKDADFIPDELSVIEEPKSRLFDLVSFEMPADSKSLFMSLAGSVTEPDNKNISSTARLSAESGIRFINAATGYKHIKIFYSRTEDKEKMIAWAILSGIKFTAYRLDKDREPSSNIRAAKISSSDMVFFCVDPTVAKLILIKKRKKSKNNVIFVSDLKSTLSIGHRYLENVDFFMTLNMLDAEKIVALFGAVALPWINKLIDHVKSTRKQKKTLLVVEPNSQIRPNYRSFEQIRIFNKLGTPSDLIHRNVQTFKSKPTIDDILWASNVIADSYKIQLLSKIFTTS